MTGSYSSPGTGTDEAGSMVDFVMATDTYKGSEDGNPAAQDNVERTIRLLALKVYGSLPKPSSVELSDLVQAGNVGLLQAKRSYDPSLGVPLSAYARYRIRGEMLEAVHRASPLGNHIRREGQTLPIRTVPFDGWTEESSFVAKDWIPEKQLAHSQHRRILNEAIRRLPHRDRRILELKYGEEFTLREIGSMMQVKESRACQLHRQALASLRRALNRQGVSCGAWRD